MQEALDSTYSRKVQVQDRFGSHATGSEEYHILSTLTDSGTKKSVGLTEMKCLQTDLLADFLISVATSTLEEHVRELSKHNVIEWLLVTPVIQIPWYGLCQWLYESNRLGDIISFLHRQVKIPPGMSYSDVPSATRYIGRVSCEYSKKYDSLKNRTIVILSYYEPNILIPHLISKAKTVFRSLSRSRYDVPSIVRQLLEPSTITYSNACIKWIEYLIATAMFDHTDEEWYEDVDYIFNKSELHKFPLLNSEKGTLDYIESQYNEYLNNTLELNLLKRAFDSISHIDEGRFLDMMIGTHLNLHIDAINDTYLGEAEQPYLEVVVTTLTECIENVRFYRRNRDKEADEAAGEDSNGVNGTHMSDNSIVGSLNPPNLGIIKKGVLPNPHYVCGYNEDQPSAARLQYEELNVSEYHTLSMNPAVYFRVRGDANSSSTTLLS